MKSRVISMLSDKDRANDLVIAFELLGVSACCRNCLGGIEVVTRTKVDDETIKLALILSFPHVTPGWSKMLDNALATNSGN